MPDITSPEHLLSRIEAVNSGVQKIMSNDLPHIRANIAAVKVDLSWVKWLVVTVLAAVLTGMVATVLSLFKVTLA